MKTARILAICTLAFLAVSAVAGAVPMLLHPEGGRWLPLSLLQYSGFHSFLIPGILLLATNGLLAFVVLWMVLRRQGPFASVTAAQGVVLTAWLIIEMILLRGVHLLHVLYLGVALVILLCGLAMVPDEPQSREQGRG